MNNKDLFIPLPLAKFSAEILASLKSFVRVSPKISLSPLSITQSKLCGIPYWPHEISAYPKDKQGNAMKLAAQINFNEVYQSLGNVDYPTNFPKDGLLQFFLPKHSYNNSYWGVCFDSLGNKSNDIAVIYHESINDPHLLTNSLSQQISDNTNFPINTECELKFSNESQFCPLTDTYYNKYFYHYFVEDLCANQKIEFYESEEFDASGCKLDGYAHFIQDDPRTDIYDEDNPWILLLQIDSFQKNGNYICNWGDFGTANWFIRKNDLINKDFSKVLFHWDYS